jgi:hypothetical protein
MGNKKMCDLCGKAIPSTVNLPYNAAVGMYSGRFVYGSAHVEEAYDLCRECGAKIRDFIRTFKKSAKIKEPLLVL